MDYVLFHILSGNKLHINIKGGKKKNWEDGNSEEEGN
jgi:hypothetical protein